MKEERKMASFANSPQLTIAATADPNKSDVSVVINVNWDAYDVAADQPYRMRAELWGDDTNVGDPNTAGADDFRLLIALETLRPSQTVFPKTYTKLGVQNVILNEDALQIPNPDELFARVTLTPQPPQVVGPVPSNTVKLTIT